MGLLIASIVLTVLTFIGIIIGRGVYDLKNNKDDLAKTPEDDYNKRKTYRQPDWEDLTEEQRKGYIDTYNEQEKLNKKESRKYFIRTLICSLLSVGWFIILLFGSFCKVNANEVGIIYDDRYGVLETVKYEGFQRKSIFQHITTISTINRSSSLRTTGQTSDGQYATFELSLIYRIDKDNAGKFYKVTSSDDIPRDALNTIVKSSLQSSTIKYDIFDLLST